MNKILSSAHVHTTFCDGKNTVQEIVQKAYEMGVVSLGISSHAIGYDHVVRLSQVPGDDLWEHIAL